MKMLFVLSALVMGLNAHAGKVVNARTGQELVSNCTKFDSNNSCSEYDVMLSDSTGTTKLATVKVHPLTNGAEEFQIRNKLAGFEFFPLWEKAEESDVYSSIRDVAGVSAAAGMGSMLVAVLVHSNLIFGTGFYVTAAATLVIFAPGIADVASMPVRALIKGMKIRQAKKTEKLAFAALTTLLDSSAADMTIKGKSFEKVVGAFQSMTNQQ